ncbi:alcohol dehydrogenase catalytic domain-containing protein [Mycobacterium sp. 5-140-3-2]|uniref:alcohol dehydrogenase catalytic domain-containing protein n=1 Tax=unclassified Mycobacterium TaxID=2642494 RepID=UPI002D78D848|nr:MULTISPECIES: alcohol dehydrogenase catalytic domain-containing protein [unclassified Mycobacterium]WRU85053.1 alcohol dehydrogenase catalytic domain-containing protein [Mycobacterium sp. 5-140-3-2]WSE42520.1 alcohol dehydrogenase catalytic domain-containing protein [Mycobacterium sp. 5-140-3-1]
MRAVIMDSKGTVHVADRPNPTLPGPQGVIVAVEATGICGSDLHFYDGDLPSIDGLSIGHEAVGVVVEVGDAVRRVSVGDRVVVSCITGCGHCHGCAVGDPATCDTGASLFGFGGELAGAQAELLAVPVADATLLPVPASISDEAAVLLADNLATAWTAARRGDVGAGAAVLVLGLGAVGQCAVRCALQLGAATVLAYDPVEGRRARAASCGATAIGGPDVAAAVAEATRGRGVDAVIDAVATDASLDSAVGAVRAGGTISVVGIHDAQPYPFPMLQAVYKSITLRTSMAAVQSAWRELLPLIMAGRLDTSGIITQRHHLEDAPQAYELVAARSPECTKVLLIP